jgi:hypothetical protein
MAKFRSYLEDQKKKHPKEFAAFDDDYEEFKLEALRVPVCLIRC